MRVLYPDLAAVWPGLANPHEASYAVASPARLLPNGLVGIMLAAMFSATDVEPLRAVQRARARSSRRTSTRRSSPPQASERRAADRRLDRDLRRGRDHDRAGHGAWRRTGQSIFAAMLTFNTIMSLAYGPPALLGLVVKRTPSWSGLAQLRGRPGRSAATARSSGDWSLVRNVADHRPGLGARSSSWPRSSSRRRRRARARGARALPRGSATPVDVARGAAGAAWTARARSSAS